MPALTSTNGPELKVTSQSIENDYMLAAILFKFLILFLFLLIFLSLTGGLFFLSKDKGNSKRILYSLTARVVLSVSLFILLIIGFFTGLIQPHGLIPEQPENKSDVTEEK